jgi:uncharacterized protein YcfJ
MKKQTLLSTVTALTAGLLLANSTLAGPGYSSYAKVTRAQPIYQTVTQRVPQQSCHIETVAYHQPGRNASTATVMGGLIGAAIGNELGHSKRNKQVGAVAGGLLGAAIASDASRSGPSSSTRYRDEQVCHTSYHTQHTRELVGYDVSYRYQGKHYHTRTAQHPGDRIRVNVDVRPARVF